MTIPRPLAYLAFISPYVAALFVVAWIVTLRFPNGPFVASTTFASQSTFIQPFLPAERVTVPGIQPGGWNGQRVRDEPAYFTARVPGPYEKVDVALEFRTHGQPMLGIGLVRDASGKEIELAPLYSEELQGSEWNVALGGYLHSGQASYRLTQPDPTNLATWVSSFTAPALSDPAGSLKQTVLSLRGAHDFYLVPAGGKLEATFALQDVNRATGTSPVIFRVYRGGVEINREFLSLSGSRDRSMGKPILHRISLDYAEPGVYRVAVQAPDDIFIRGIETTSRRWVIGPRLYLADVVGFATSTFSGSVWTDSRHLSLETVHGEGMQTVSLGHDRASVDRTHAVYRLDRTHADPAPAFLSAPAGDIKIIGDGWFAFSRSAYFQPQPRRYTDGMQLASEGLVGVLTSYVRPLSLADGWFAATTSFALAPSQNSLRFVLSAPGIALRQGSVDIRRITLTYKRDATDFGPWQIVRQELARIWRRMSGII